MAPTRKKGTNKAAAAAEAAGQRKWKVGDLVLAKVKGFPAWPAKVTEPKIWGFPTDWKKVLVSFFGTQQFAFCCPVDVEEFTEKTKVYLLGKRHGKSSDFIRALDEIIDCFENLKEQDEADKDEAAVTKAILPTTNATNDLNSLTEAAEAAAAEDALHDGERQLVEARKETPICPTSSTRSKTHVAQSRRRTGRRGSARMLSSSSGIDADSLHDRFMRSSKGMVKSSANSEGHNVDLPDIVSNGSKPVAGKLISENDEGETELSGRLDFQPNTIILKKKRKLNRKRLSNDTAGAGGLDIVVSETEVLKTKCVSPSNKEKMVKRSAKDDLDAHLPLVKRARVRMGRPSPVAEQEDTSVYEDGKMLVVPESLGLQSSGPLNWKVDAPADGKSAPTRRDLPDSSLSQAGPLEKPQFWESRKNFTDDEAALPPSKRLLRALEAMSANVAEDAQRASGCSPTGNTRSNECATSSSVKCFKSIENKVVTALGSRPLEDHRNLDSRSSASELRDGLDMEMTENEAKTSLLVSDSGKTSLSIDSSNPPDRCSDSFKYAEGAGSKPLMISPLNDYPAEVIAEHQHLKPDSPILIKGMDTTIQIDSPDSDGDDGGDEKHKTKHLLLDENNQESQGPEFLADARPVSSTSIFKPSATPVKALTGTHFQSQFCSNSISDDHLEGRTVSVIQSSSSLTNGLDSVPRTSLSSSSLCNIPASDNNNYLENSSCSLDVQLQLEKDKFAGTSSKEELLSSFDAVIRSLTRTKESIGQATQIAIDCAKLGFAKKVVEILARSLESESSLCKKIDLFFLVDSITQCSRGMKGDCGIYPSEVQSLLPRLLFGAAPPGSSSLENHKQCLEVLRVWQERKIIPEPIICHHIRELDSLCRPYQTGGGSRQDMINERSFDDPIREMEGMLVDEYGSNSSFQLPGFCMPPMLKDDDGGSDSGGDSFEAVTPERSVENLDVEKTPIPATEKRNHILQDVDFELEMEDVAPCYESKITPSRNVSGADRAQISHHRYNSYYGAPFDPQQPKDVLLTPAPLPRSSTPLPPRAPHPIPPSTFSPSVFDSVKNGPESKLYPTSQSFNGNIHESMRKQSILPRGKPTSLSDVHHRAHEKDFEAQMSRQKPDCSNSSRLYRTNINHPANGALNKGFHLRPPRPAPSNQFSYVQERVSRRNFTPPSHHDRFHIRNAESGNFYRDRDRNKYSPRDNIGECWRPPLSPIAGPCYYDDARMAHPYAPYTDSPRRTASPNNRWNYSPRPMNHRHFNPYRPPFEGPVPVANRGPKYCRPN